MGRPEIHLISDGKLSISRFADMAAAVHPLLDYVHLREKQLSARELKAAADGLLEAGVPASKLIINDRVDVAAAVGARGAQLAWHSLNPAEARRLAPRLVLGRSVHSPEEAEEAAVQGAHFCMYGHIFPTSCKAGRPERGLAALAGVVRRCPIPVIAIGGIRPEHVPQIMRQGAAGIAVMSGICGAEDPPAAVQSYRDAMLGFAERIPIQGGEHE